MNNTIEASPYIDTIGSHKAKVELYNINFDYSFIANKFGICPEKSNGFIESDDEFNLRLNQWTKEENNVLFDGWICKDMFHYQELINHDKRIIITIESSIYEINYYNKKFLFPVLPDTIDDFINDLKKIGIKLFWKSEILTKYGIDNITSSKKIIDYYAIIKNMKNGSNS